MPIKTPTVTSKPANGEIILQKNSQVHMNGGVLYYGAYEAHDSPHSDRHRPVVNCIPKCNTQRLQVLTFRDAHQIQQRGVYISSHHPATTGRPLRNRFHR